MSTAVIDCPEFVGFPKISRLSREIVITEKLDGTNAQVVVTEDGRVLAGSRNRWITPENDNYGFASWVRDHENELRELGVGRHYGEWWGCGIQRGYGLKEKRFSLFNVSRWYGEDACRPSCCDVVPVLYCGDFSTEACDHWIDSLRQYGSRASLGFMRPEGIVIYHKASNTLFKKTIEGDAGHKGEQSH